MPQRWLSVSQGNNHLHHQRPCFHFPTKGYRSSQHHRLSINEANKELNKGTRSGRRRQKQKTNEGGGNGSKRSSGGGSKRTESETRVGSHRLDKSNSEDDDNNDNESGMNFLRASSDVSKAMKSSPSAGRGRKGNMLRPQVSSVDQRLDGFWDGPISLWLVDGLNLGNSKTPSTALTLRLGAAGTVGNRRHQDFQRAVSA